MSRKINNFSYFSNKRKASSIYQAEFSKSRTFWKNPLQTHKNVGPQTYKKMYMYAGWGRGAGGGGASIDPWHTFLCKKVASKVSHIVISLQRIRLKLHVLTKFTYLLNSA